MSIRENLEQMEQIYLSPFATKSVNSKGREREEAQCDIRPVFQRDRDRILHCKAFRRLKHKTQVFLTPKGDHYRTRLTHTLEVSQNARTIAKALRLNEYLVEAIALGHDLGHTPFGHAGERVLNELCEEGYRHNEQSVRIVEKLEVVTPGLTTPVRRLSGGNVQKILVGREIAMKPDVLMAAYPVRGLDINSSYMIYNLLSQQKEKGVCVICVGEDLDVLLELCDRIAVLNSGRLAGIVEARQTTKEKLGRMMTGSGKEEA